MTASLYCRAALNYTSDPTAASDRRRVTPFDVEILDGRSVPDLSWETQGFELRKHESAIRDWSDTQHVNALYRPEIESFAKSLTGCDFALTTPAVVRDPEAARRHADLGPTRFVHSDFSGSYRQMVEDSSHPYMQMFRGSMKRNRVDFDDIARAARIVSLHAWRNIGEREVDQPLCLCDARSVAQDELYPIRVNGYGGSDSSSQLHWMTTTCAASDAVRDHRWYTFPAMSSDEVIVFRSFDSERAARNEPYWALHSAFRDSNAPPDAAGRESIEIRILCGFVDARAESLESR